MSVPHKWEFQHGDGSWEMFIDSDNSAIEATYQAYNAALSWCAVPARVLCRLGVKRKGYLVNFKAMTRRHILSQRKNALRRVPADMTLQDERSARRHARERHAKKKLAANNTTVQLQPGPVADRCGDKVQLPTLMPSDAVRRNQTCPTPYQSSPLHKTQLEVAASPQNSPFARSVSDSIISNDGSVASEADETHAPRPSQLSRSITPFGHVICGFKKQMDSDMLAFQNIQETIDRMWLQEHNMQINAELCSVVIEAAAAIESGKNPVEVLPEAFVKVEAVGMIASKSLDDRSANRGTVTLDGGFEYMKCVVRDRYIESLQSITPLLEQLTSCQQAPKVKAIASKQLANLRAEMESINYMKEANTFTLMDIDESMEQAEVAECNFMHSVLQLANANRQNLSMQDRALRSILQVVKVYAKSQRRGTCQGECDQFTNFVVDTMRTLGQASVSVSINGCLAMGWYATYSKQRCLLVRSVILGVVDAMRAHAADSDLQDAALFALLSIAERSGENKICMANTGAIQKVLEAMENHAAHPQIQQRANKLLGILVLAGCASRVC